MNYMNYFDNLPSISSVTIALREEFLKVVEGAAAQLPVLREASKNYLGRQWNWIKDLALANPFATIALVNLSLILVFAKIKSLATQVFRRYLNPNHIGRLSALMFVAVWSGINFALFKNLNVDLKPFLIAELVGIVAAYVILSLKWHVKEYLISDRNASTQELISVVENLNLDQVENLRVECRLSGNKHPCYPAGSLLPENAKGVGQEVDQPYHEKLTIDEIKLVIANVKILYPKNGE